jgi:hypothetical protein
MIRPGRLPICSACLDGDRLNIDGCQSFGDGAIKFRLAVARGREMKRLPSNREKISLRRRVEITSLWVRGYDDRILLRFCSGERLLQ